jgi:hypothetical protein
MDHSIKGQAQKGSLPDSVADSPLFKLPPELRNMIYRYAIIDNRALRITKTAGIPEPALLSACKILKSETWKIFYLENTFLCEVDNYDPASLQIACRKQSKGSWPARSERISIGNLRLSQDGQRCWTHLVAWLHLSREAKCDGMGHDATDDAEKGLLAGLFDVACQDPSSSRKSLDLLLKSMRPALTSLHQDWGKD